MVIEDRIAGEIKQHYPCLLKFETTCQRILVSSVLNFSRCRGPPKEECGTTTLVARGVLAGLHRTS